jgi:hypothetical protein
MKTDTEICEGLRRICSGFWKENGCQEPEFEASLDYVKAVPKLEQVEQDNSVSSTKPTNETPPQESSKGEGNPL